MRRRGPSAVLSLVGALLAMALAVAAGPVPVAGAQADPSTTTESTPLTTPEGGGIIPAPDRGQPPEEAGDRGGALQIAVLVVMVGGMATIALLVRREARRRAADREGRGSAARR